MNIFKVHCMHVRIEELISYYVKITGEADRSRCYSVLVWYEQGGEGKTGISRWNTQNLAVKASRQTTTKRTSRTTTNQQKA